MPSNIMFIFPGQGGQYAGMGSDLCADFAVARDLYAKANDILGFDIKLDYPSYTLRKDEGLTNIGDLVIPQGTKVDWVFNSQNTDDISMYFSRDKAPVATNRFDNELFTYNKRSFFTYTINEG